MHLPISALDRKALRDLWHIKEQALAIALVIACGVATFIMARSTLGSLELTQQTYYDRHNFADIFANLKRAPLSLTNRIAEIPGVSTVETRVIMDVTLDVPGLKEPAVGRLISVPEHGEPKLNTVYLRQGRYLEPGRGDEVLASEGFCLANHLNPGDRITAIINGRKKQLKIVGIALSPEYIYQIRAGDLLPDDRRFGVFWMAREPLEAAFNMDGAFNDLCLALMPTASVPEVIRRVDQLLEPYGGLMAYHRDDQMSNRFLTNELLQLRGMGVVAPSIFLSVAAFLLNVVLARIINQQREQIAALKAFGYTNLDVGLHYIKLVLSIAMVGVVLGILFGAYLGQSMTVMYAKFYRFPFLHFRLGSDVLGMALVVSAAAAVLGTLGAVWRAVKLPPAEAMRPEPPANYKPTIVERLGLASLLSQSARMILRHLEREYIKAGMSVFGIAMAVAVLVLGNVGVDALDYMIDIQFNFAQRQDLNVSFVEPRPARTLHELENLPGVRICEPFRAVPARLEFGNRDKRLGLMGLVSSAQLQRVINEFVEPVTLPAEGLVIGTGLAELLNVTIGDLLTIHVLEGARPVYQVPVVAMVTEFVGNGAYMDIRALNRLMREGRTISGGYLVADGVETDHLYDTLKHTPGVASVSVRKAAIKNFEETVAENMLRMRLFNIIFAVTIAFGVVYNSARIALAERSRELASLRVMGFTRGEISVILLGELAVLTLAALPPGLLLGYGFALMMFQSVDTELFRIPLVINNSTYAFAVVVVVVAAAISGLVVRRKLDHLDLVAVLKTRD
jgi:putative ABC transport system permease protein